MDNLFMEDFVDLKNIENENHIIRGDIRLKKLLLILIKILQVLLKIIIYKI